jgi:hypothetical protein
VKRTLSAGRRCATRPSVLAAAPLVSRVGWHGPGRRREIEVPTRFAARMYRPRKVREAPWSRDSRYDGVISAQPFSPP